MVLSLKLRPTRFVEHFSEQHSFCLAMPLVVKPRPNALDFSLYIARQMSSIVECCRDGGGQTLSTFHSTWSSIFHGCII